MLFAFDTITFDQVSADEVARNNIDEPFRYECLCCGEEVHIAAARSKHMVPHFRHLRGNSDTECELYLGGLLQTKTGIESAIEAAKKRARSRAEILFDIEYNVFYFALSFSEEKIEEYQKGECELEIYTGSNHAANTVMINRFNFAPDSLVKIPLKLSSNSCRISIRSKNKTKTPLVSNYEILKPIDFPTFFKPQSVSDGASSITKRHTDGIIYTETNYYLIASQKAHIEKIAAYSPAVSIGNIKEFFGLGTTLYGADIMISAVTQEFQDTLKYFGYYLRKAEQLSLLWPPSYTVDDEYRCDPGRLYISSSYPLKPRSNISCEMDQLSIDDSIYVIDFKESLRISKANTTLQISPETDNMPISSNEPTIITARTVDVGDAQVFYCVGKGMCRMLSPGLHHIEKGTIVLECKANYPIQIYKLPDDQPLSAVKTLMDVRKYYKVSVPYKEDMIADVKLSKVAEIYIEECRNTQEINVKALEYIKAGVI